MSLSPPRRLFLCLTLTAAALALSGCPESDTGGGTATSLPDILIDISSPGYNKTTKQWQVVAGQLTVSGSLREIKGLKKSSLETKLLIKGFEPKPAKGASKFTFKIDTTAKDKKGKPLVKDGKFCGSLVATGKNTAGDEANGSVQVCATVDNTMPSIKIESPTAGSTHIGKVLFKGRIDDKNLADVQIHVGGKLLVKLCNKNLPAKDAKSCQKCEATAGIQKCITGPGIFSFLVNRGDEPTAEDLEFKVTAKDLANQQNDLSVLANILKPPKFDVVRRDAAPPPTLGASSPTAAVHGDIRSFELADFDGDKTIDAVLATSTGVFLRRGLKASVTDKPTGPTATGNGRFGEAELVAAGDFTHLVLAHLDDDPGKPGSMLTDVVAGGDIATDVSGLVALLSRPANTKAKVKGGLKQVAVHNLEAQVKAMAVGDMDNNGATDVVIGGSNDPTALTVVYLNKDPLCPTKEEPKRKCAGLAWKELGAAKLVSGSTVQKLAGGVTSLAIGDYVQDNANPALLDVAMGRGKPAISVCRNVGTGFGACVETTQSDFLNDMKDAQFIVPVQWNDDDGDGDISDKDYPDLIVGSKNGMIRWVSGNSEGGYDFDSSSIKPKYRTHYISSSIESMTLAPVGPNGENYLIVTTGSRTAVLLPVDPTDETFWRRCYRSFILGKSVTAIRAADLDGDGVLDLIALTEGAALSIAMGKGEGDFHAAAVHRVCGYAAVASAEGIILRSTLPVARFGVQDLSGDDRADLLIASTDSVASVLKPTSSGNVPQPAYYFGLYMNSSEGLDPVVRTGEFGPYNTLKMMKASGIKDTLLGGAGKKLPLMVGLEFGQFNSQGPLDMVTVYQRNYPIGADVESKVGNPLLTCATHEVIEMMNIFGEENNDNKDLQGKLCKLYSVGDTEKNSPLTGPGEGSFLARTSLHVWINTKSQEPFGIEADSPPDKPSQIKPFYAQSAGIGIIDAVVGDFDDDSNADVAVVMDEAGSFGPRVRTFKGLKGEHVGKVGPVFYVQKNKGGPYQAPGSCDKPTSPTCNKCPPDDMMCNVTRYCLYNSTQCVIVEMTKENLSKLAVKDKLTGALTWMTPSYMVLPPGPISIRTAPFCDDSAASLFTLNSNNGSGSYSWLRRLQGNQVFDKSVTATVVSKGVSAFRPMDLTQDGCTDLLFGSSGQMGFALGNTEGFTENTFFNGTSGVRTAIDTFDVNDDKVLDMLVVDGENDRVEVWLGSLTDDGNGGKKLSYIQAPQPLFTLGNSSHLAQADLNGDGCPDLAVQGEYGVTVLLNLGCPAP